MIVADTCLIFHLFNETPLTFQAQKVLEKDSQFILPPLWKEEYANVLAKLARKENRNISEVTNHYNYTLNELQTCEIFVETVQALEIAVKFKISVYDAHFVALAIEYDTILVTEDKEVLKKCPKLAVNFHEFSRP